MFYLHDFEPDASKWNLTVAPFFGGVTTCSQYRVFTLYYYHLVINWSTHQWRYQHPPFSTNKSSEARTSAALQAEQEAGWFPWDARRTWPVWVRSLRDFSRPSRKKKQPLDSWFCFSKKKYFPGTCFFFFGSQWIFFRDRPPINLGPPGTPYYSAQAQRMRLFRCPFAEVAFLWWLWISRHQIGVPPRVMYKTKRDNFLQNNGSTFF